MQSYTEHFFVPKIDCAKKDWKKMEKRLKKRLKKDWKKIEKRLKRLKKDWKKIEKRLKRLKKDWKKIKKIEKRLKKDWIDCAKKDIMEMLEFTQSWYTINT